MVSLPLESIMDICNSDMNIKYEPLDAAREKLFELAMLKAESFHSLLYTFYLYIANFILKRNKYHKSITSDEYQNRCLIIFQIIVSLLHDKNYFKQDENSIVFYYNLFSLSSRKKLFYKNIIRKKLIVDFNINNNIDEYVHIIITLLFQMLGNNNYFKGVLDFYANADVKRDMRTMNAAEKFEFKCLILDYIKSELFTQQEIHNILNVDPKTIRHIQKMYESNPFLSYDDLHEKKHGPKPNPYTQITEAAWEDLQNAMTQLPTQFDLTYAGWGTKAIQKYLEKYHNIVVSQDYLRHFLRNQNYTCKVGKRKNPKQSEEEVKEFLTERYEEELRKAKENNERVLFVDEMHIQQGYGNRSYAPKGQRSVTSYHQSAKHTNYSLLTFIGFDGFISCHIIEGTVDTGWFIFYLKELKKNNKNEKFLIFTDNCSIHKSEELNNWLKRKNGGKDIIRIKYLPQYSPELNPVEFYNNDFHTHLEKIALKNAQEVIEESYSYIAWYRDNKNNQATDKVKSYFYAPECRYTIEIYNKIQSEIN